MSKNLPELPELDGGIMGKDMMLEIFLKSSMKCLKQLSLVSRNWENFLTGSAFNRMYHEKNGRNNALALPASENKVVLLEKTRPPVFSALKLPIECQRMMMIGSCEGLLGFVYSGRGFLWNPVNGLGKCFDLPLSISQRQISVGLGYDFSSLDYKIVILVRISALQSQIMIYTSRNDSWREVSIAPFLARDSNSKFILKGTPYWVGKDLDKRDVVFSFDPTSEAYNLISYPKVDGSKTIYVVCNGNHIGALSHSSIDQRVDIFFLGEEGWVKFFAPVGTIKNAFEVKIMQYFQHMIICWDSPLKMSFYDSEPLLQMSELMNPFQLRVNESYYHVNSMIRVSGASCYYPRSVGEVFRDYKRRRLNLITALTTDSEMFCQLCEFYENCFPKSAAIRLYGLPDGWEVREVSSEPQARRQGPGEPEPLHIHVAMSSMDMNTWLCSVANDCDHWLVAVAFHTGASFGFDRAARKRLFMLINDLPTVNEVVRGACQKQLKEQTFLLDK